MKSQKYGDAKDKLMAAIDECKSLGMSVVCVVARYADKDNTFFSTRLSLTAMPELDVTEDHIMLDAQREISVQWHNNNHEAKLEFVHPRRRLDHALQDTLEDDRS